MHNCLRDAVHTSAKQAGLNPAKEESSLLPGSDEKPADVFLPSWAQGRDAAIDVSVVSPLQRQLVKKAGEEMGSAAEKRFKEKNNKYFESCNNEGIQFYPLIVETFGGWHPDSEAIITKLASQSASQSGGVTAEVSRHLFQRLGILLARGNASLITTRSPQYVEALVDGDVDIEL